MSSLSGPASFGITARTAPSFEDEVAPVQTPELTFVEAVELRAAQKRNQVPIQRKRRSKHFLRWTAYLVVAILLVTIAVAILDELKTWYDKF